jgi:hypothetical protein
MRRTSDSAKRGKRLLLFRYFESGGFPLQYLYAPADGYPELFVLYWQGGNKKRPS